MKLAITILVAAFSVALVSSIPVPEDRALRSQALDRLVMVEGDNEEALRSKRTIGVLRQLFPEISQMIEQTVNAVTSEIIKVLGPIVLRGVLGNGGDGGTNGGSGNTGSTANAEPPFGDDDDGDSSSGGSSDSEPRNGPRNGPIVSTSLPTHPPDEDDAATESTVANGTTTVASTSSSSARSKRSPNVNPEAEERLIEEEAESQNNEVRVQFSDDQSNAAANEAVESELAPLEDIEVSDDENRNKRFLNFGFGASGGAGASAGSGGSGGGSGNFLFDIIRLVAGSGSSQQGDVAAGAPSPGKNDGTTEAVPGPVTRLFVIANRGISNLIQDLILRLAATSERIVNFKARLITSII